MAVKIREKNGKRLPFVGATLLLPVGGVPPEGARVCAELGCVYVLRPKKVRPRQPVRSGPLKKGWTRRLVLTAAHASWQELLRPSWEAYTC
jgi:hypothetical protein